MKNCNTCSNILLAFLSLASFRSSSALKVSREKNLKVRHQLSHPLCSSAYYDFFPPKRTNVSVVTRQSNGETRQVLVVDKDVAAGEVIYKVRPNGLPDITL